MPLKILLGSFRDYVVFLLGKQTSFGFVFLLAIFLGGFPKKSSGVVDNGIFSIGVLLSFLLAFVLQKVLFREIHRKNLQEKNQENPYFTLNY